MAQKRLKALQMVMNDKDLQHAQLDLITKQDKEKLAFLEAMAVKQMVMPCMLILMVLEHMLK
ncbi:hypothetical protein AMAG_08680 [Allomyces macrogynus ATCC 38327]|uniref:Uncharacterized protein n=1 Tax=Allomyces macrogynus (strain ATCC 38327) TaxID=578462 RepID=A0A0L0SM05_ALLM3|nr:hypothetical protein AMAG_08680 [Allomyces macrogynus ATCC 38327]|eukprot:KNE63571.1 hypothetical protein AMAG_08680 [Allomyces macrogynus ATCC 38327]